MRSALIGYTGFVGSNIHLEFTDRYNSTNILSIRGKEYDLVVCAGAPATKWWANQNPERDREAIQYLISNLSTIKAKHFVLISTIDVYNDHETYGKNRKFLEEFVKFYFNRVSIVRLPALFGEGLKKNILFDMLTGKVKEISSESLFQWYNLSNLTHDLRQTVLNGDKTIYEFFSPPISLSSIAQMCGVAVNILDYSPKVVYNYSQDGKFFVKKDAIIFALNSFVDQYRRKK